MIFKRAAAKLRAQDWTAIAIEFGIVVAGVFVGTWVANWNEQRQEAAQTRQMLLQLKPELGVLERFSGGARRYYAATAAYARTAFAGWAGDPRIDDSDFVIAAYQASQVVGFNNNGASWALTFGAGELRNIGDPAVRRPLTRLMTFDYSTLNFPALATRYRDEVRVVIPNSIQEQVRGGCGDHIQQDGRSLSLTYPCTLKLDPVVAAAAAAELRRHPELPRLLAQHRSAVATYLVNLQLFDVQEAALARQVDRLSHNG